MTHCEGDTKLDLLYVINMRTIDQKFINFSWSSFMDVTLRELDVI